MDKDLIFKLSFFLPPPTAMPQCRFVDGYGYETQEDGSVNISDAEGNHITTIWRDDEGRIVAYEDPERQQTVIVSEEDGYFAESYSCNPEEQSCWYYHDDTQQTTNSAQRFSEVPTQTEAPTPAPAQSRSHVPTKPNVVPPVDDNNRESVHAHEAPVHGGTVAQGPVSHGPAESQPATVALNIAEQGSSVQSVHTPISTGTGSSAQHEQHTVGANVVNAETETESVATEGSHTAVVEGAVLCTTGSEDASVAAAIREEAILQQKLSEDIAALTSGQVFVGGVVQDDSGRAEVQTIVPDIADVEHRSAPNEHSTPTAHVVSTDVEVRPTETHSQTQQVAAADSELGADIPEMFFVGSPIFFMPPHSTTGTMMAMQPMTDTQQRVVHVGSRGNPPDHEDSQGNRERDDGQNEENDETLELEVIA